MGLAIYRWKAMETNIMTELKFLAKYKWFKSSFENGAADDEWQRALFRVFF